MKNLFSKALLCGVLASSFAIVNCQKAPSLGVKAQTDGTANTNVAPKIGTCSDAAVSAVSARKTALDALKAELAKDNSNLDDPGKQNIVNLANDLAAKSRAAIAAIRAIQVQGASADSCTVADPANPGKNITNNIQAMIDENKSLGSAVFGVTNKANDLQNFVEAPSRPASGDPTQVQPQVLPDEGGAATNTSGDASSVSTNTSADQQEVATEMSATPVLENQTLIASKDLAEASNQPNSQSKKYFEAGVVKTDASTEIRDKSLARDKSICIINATAGNLAANSEIKILSIIPAVAAEGIATVSMSAKSRDGSQDEAYGMTCYVAHGVTDTGKAIGSALGSLIAHKVVATVTSGDATPASGDNSAAGAAAATAP